MMYLLTLLAISFAVSAVGWLYFIYFFSIGYGFAISANDRLQVRLAEIEESVKIVRQALKRLAPGPVDIVDPRIRVPAHKLAYQDMEALIGRFKRYYPCAT